MTATNPTKTSLLEHFYEYLDRTDWLDGVDLYQAGKVVDVTTFDSLVTGRVTIPGQPSAEVRLKIHPTGQCIQWIECTCRKNRAQNRYCEHIAAFMIHIDREQAQLLSGLDSRMPLKPPTLPRRPRIGEIEVQIEKTHAKQITGAAQTILDHLKGSIQGVSLQAGGPGIRVRLELKPGHLTYYDLNVDAAAAFLASHPRLKMASPEIAALKVSTTPVELGTRLMQVEDEKIVAERVAVLRLRPRDLTDDGEVEGRTLVGDKGKFKRYSTTDREGHEGLCEFLPIKSVSKFLGEKFLFIPGRGYWPVLREGITPDWAELPLNKGFKEDAAAELVKGGFADYLVAGPIWLDDALQKSAIIDTPQLSEIKIHHAEDGWFMLDPRYGEGRGSVSMADLMKHFRKKKRRYLKTGNQWLRIPDFVTEHNWTLDEKEELVKVDTMGLLRIKASIGHFDQFVGSRKLLNLIRERTEFQPECDYPNLDHTKLTLRSYQETGVRWLWWLYQNHLHGLLADEMGLGKTHQAMALMSAIQKIQKDAKFLVIAPTTVLDHWEDKVNDFCPNLRTIRYHGPRRGDILRQFTEQGDVLITSYGVLLRDIKDLMATPWQVVVLDEAHLVKNNQTATYQAACRLPARLRICLTGTPMENHLGELKNLFDFLVPGYLGSDDYFRKHILNPIKQDVSPESELALQKLVHPFKMRRTKDQVLKDLPAKIEDKRHCGLADEQVKLYRDVVAMRVNPIIQQLQDESQPVPYLHVFAVLTLLKQICDHPALITEGKDWRAHESGKFDLLKDLVAEALASDNKIVIYSQYVGMVSIIEQYLTENNIGHVTLTGQSRNRGRLISTFQETPDCKVFCSSLLAGGIGIDLTAASVVIHYDRWWNASKENQATDRVHRIGQVKNVQVFKLISRGTLEEKIDAMIAAKQELFEKFLDNDEKIFKTLSRQELIDLLQ